MPPFILNELRNFARHKYGNVGCARVCQCRLADVTVVSKPSPAGYATAYGARHFEFIKHSHTSTAGARAHAVITPRYCPVATTVAKSLTRRSAEVWMRCILWRPDHTALSCRSIAPSGKRRCGPADRMCTAHRSPASASEPPIRVGACPSSIRAPHCVQPGNAPKVWLPLPRASDDS